jgi:hypothetical protein
VKEDPQIGACTARLAHNKFSSGVEARVTFGISVIRLQELAALLTVHLSETPIIKIFKNEAYIHLYSLKI